MPRLRQVPRSEIGDPAVLAWYDRVFGDRDPVNSPGTATGSAGSWWTTYALLPDVFTHVVQGVELHAAPGRPISAQLRELCQTRAGWARGSKFVFSQHSKFARAVGLSDEKVAAIPAWQLATCYSAEERAALAYTDCLVLDGGRVPDGIFEELRSHLSDEQILELTVATCLYEMHSTICRALRLEFDDVDDRVTEEPAAQA